MAETDLELLGRFARMRAEDAFAEIVRRHLGLVYSAALRQVRSPQLAEEVSQSVFLDLARQSDRLASNTILTAWLYQVTRRTAIDVVRRESRRQLREQIATEMNAMNATTDDWRHVEPLLDEAMEALDATDRAAVLLRYFENKSLREVGTALGASDDAAQKRVSRAVERLREFFAKRGVTAGASGLAVVISANAVQAAPAALAISISTAAALSGTVIATTATKAIVMSALQKTIVGATLAAAVGTGIYEARQASNLETQVHALKQNQAPLSGQLQQLQKERDDMVVRLANTTDELTRARSNNAELLKLRGEMTRLRQVAGALAQSNNAAGATTNDSLGAAADAWAKRANYFKQWFAENPEKNIPELRLLDDANWLGEASRNLEIVTNRSEGNDMHLIAYGLRSIAKSRFARLTSHALGNYVAAHSGSLPNQPQQLLPYFAPAGEVSPLGEIAKSVDAAMLQRYELLHTGQTGALTPTEPILREKAPVDDIADAVLSISAGSYSMQSTGKVRDEMKQGQGIAWYKEDLEKIKPFLK